MLQCPEPGCERQFKNAAGLSGHLRQIHGKGGKMSVSVPIADFAALQKDVESLGKHQGEILQKLEEGKAQAEGASFGWGNWELSVV